jgi:hypothetical protein
MKTVFLLLLLFNPQNSGKDNFSIPTRWEGTTAAYLATVKVDTPFRQLSPDERNKIVRLFVWSYVTSIRRFNQDYGVATDAPLYQLLKTNFPAVAEAEGEDGASLYKITRFFNRLPEYESIVDNELKRRAPRQCSGK